MIVVADLESFLQQDLTEYQGEANQAIDMAVSVVETYCRRSFARVVDDEITLRWRPSIVLPNPPVASITSVEVDGAAATYEVDDWGNIWPTTRGSEIVVTYTHGYANAPEAVRLVALRLAARVFKNPLGRVTFTADNMNYSGAMDTSPRILTGDEMAALRRFRLHAAR